MTNHSHVMICLVQNPESRLRDIAARVGITERAVLRIITDLEASGALTRIREGRRNRYQVDLSTPLRHPIESGFTVGDLIGSLL